MVNFFRTAGRPSLRALGAAHASSNRAAASSTQGNGGGGSVAISVADSEVTAGREQTETGSPRKDQEARGDDDNGSESESVGAAGGEGGVDDLVDYD